MADILSNDTLKVAESICSLVSDIREHKTPSFKDCVKDHKELERARGHLLSCRELNRLLLSLARSVARRQRSLEEKVVIPAMNHLGMQKIPDELLARIVELLPVKDRARTTLVCRRFRDTLLAMPNLWTEIQYSLPERAIDRLLLLSKDAPLHLILDKEGGDVSSDMTNLQKMLLLMKHCQRWHHITFEETFFTTPTLRMARALDFDAVKYMSLPSFEDDADADRDEEEGFNDKSPMRSLFYELLKENKNSVTRLVLREHIEPDPNLFPSLIYLRVVLDRPSLFREDELFAFLAGRKQLKSLSIEIDATTTDYEHLECKKSTKIVKLLGLRKLHISMRMDPEEDSMDTRDIVDSHESLTRAFCNLIRCFDVPNVESIEIGWTQDDDIYEEEKLAPLPCVSDLFYTKRMEKLKRLQLVVNPFSDQQMLGDILPFLKSMRYRAPNLEDISCRMPTKFIENNTCSALVAPPTLAFLGLVYDFKEFVDCEEEFERRQKIIRVGDGHVDNIRHLLEGVSLTVSPI